MKIKSNVLFGLIVLICSISGFSLLKQMTRDMDEWRPSDLYSTTNVSRRSTYSVVSSGASASYSGAVPSMSSGVSSMFRHRGVSSYAPVVSAPAYSFSPLASSPLASSPQGGLYATSSAEFRSFGGGGNVGGVSMSGGSVKSSNSSVATASGLNVSMPSTSMYAYDGNRSSASDVMSSMSGDIAMASTQAYAGIGNTTGGGSRGISGRRDVPSIGGGSTDESVFMSILVEICGGSADLTLTDDQLGFKWAVYYATGGVSPADWERFLAWYQSIRTLPETPVGDAVLFVMCCALLYVVYIYLKRKKISVL